MGWCNCTMHVENRKKRKPKIHHEGISDETCGTVSDAVHGFWKFLLVSNLGKPNVEIVFSCYQ